MTDARPSLSAALDLPPEDALRAFRARDRFETSVSWRDLEPEAHARAFTVAKIAKLDLLASIKLSLDDAMAAGQTFDQWQRELMPTLERANWWGEVRDRELTGTSAPVFVGERRLRTIFRTNMRVSAAAGQWARIQSLKDVRPFLVYDAVLDRRTRPLHRAWDGIVLPVDHPFWLTHFPPNDWGCRCSVRQLSQRDLDRLGLKVTPDDALPPAAPIGRAFIGPRGADGERPVRPVVPGVGAGWNYNPGVESLRGVVERAADSIRQARERGLDAAAQALLDDAIAVLPPSSAQALRAASAHPLSADAIDAFVAETLADATLNRGRLTLHFVERADAADIPPGSRAAFKRDLFRHVLNRHGEASNDRYPVTTDDYLLIPAIIERGSARPSRPTQRGHETVEFTLDLSGMRYTLALAHLKSRTFKGYAVQSFRKRPTGSGETALS